MKNNKHFFNPNLLDISLIINTIQTIGCISYTKGTILKANHNEAWKFWKEYRCISYTKGTILKANHNFAVEQLDKPRQLEVLWYFFELGPLQI